MLDSGDRHKLGDLPVGRQAISGRFASCGRRAQFYAWDRLSDGSPAAALALGLPPVPETRFD